MNKSNTDIELIRKYYNGELSPTAKHELEKRALDDPFLKDAMDGYEQFSIQQKDFEILNNLLANRINKKEKAIAIWGFKQWSIAASLIFGIAAISIYFNQTPENKVIAVSEIQKKERLPKSVKILEDTLSVSEENSLVGLIDNSPNIVQNVISTSSQDNEFSPTEEITLQPLAQLIGDSVMLNEVTVVGYGTQSKKEVMNSVARFKGEEIAKLNSDVIISEKASGLSLAKIGSPKNQQIVGKVISNEDRTALPGVQIINTNSGATAISNNKGEFKIAAEQKDELTVKYIGFLTENIAINKNDSLKIALKSDKKNLSEVVITGYRNPKKSSQTFAVPKSGWKEFRKYLDENATLINGEKGKVIVQFTIQPNGKLNNFTILKSFNTTANNKAIQLIKTYPTWLGSSNGISQKVKIAVRFK